MWFLLDSIKQQIEKAMSSGMSFSAEERAEIEAKSEDNGKMTLSGKSAVISIEGVLTEKRDFFAAWFGGGNTTYPEIISALAQADASKDVDKIVLAVNSPGGNVNGMFAAMDAVRATKKPVEAIVRNMATSAAFGIVSQADQVVASNRGTQFGSVGVAYDTLVFDGEVKEVSISSTEAPDKRPDLLTEGGKQVIREQLDDIHTIFAESIAAGRKTTVKKVNKDFGRGAIVLANDALEAGMIDGIQSVVSDKPKQTANGGNNTEVRSMDLNKLKTEHRAVYDEAVEIGAKKERDRVSAHMKWGVASGDMGTATKAIEEGAEMTQSLLATYQTAQLNKNAVANRGADNPDLDPPPKTEPVAADELDKEIVALMDGSDGQVGVWLGEEVTNG